MLVQCKEANHSCQTNNMKGAFFVFVLCLSVSLSFADPKYSKSYFEGERYVGHPDDFGKFVRPCQVFDLNCIRLFFAKHAKCNIVYGPLPDHIQRSQFTIYFSRLNTSITFDDGVLDGFNNTRIEDFYIDKVTNNAVFTIQMRNTVETCPSAYFEFFRRGREPITEVDFAQVFYQSLTVTAVIPNINDMKLDEAEVTLFAETSNPPLIVGPSIANNLDETVVRAVVGLIADEPTDLQELFLTESPFYIALYIQTNICDFGLKVL